MQKATHLAMGLYLFVVLERFVGVENNLILFLIVMLGSILPDIDIATSTLGRKIKIVGDVFKHRGFIHTIYMLILFSLLIHAIWNNWIYTIGFGLSYGFHLVLDGVTKMGIKPFWFGPKFKGFAKTGKTIDKLLLAFLIVASVAMGLRVV